MPEFNAPDGICIVNPVAVCGGFELDADLNVESIFCADDLRRMLGFD